MKPKDIIFGFINLPSIHNTLPSKTAFVGGYVRGN